MIRLTLPRLSLLGFAAVLVLSGCAGYPAGNQVSEAASSDVTGGIAAATDGVIEDAGRSPGAPGAGEAAPL